MDALAVIAAALNEFDVEDFIDEDFNRAAAAKIVAELEWQNFRIVKMERKPMAADIQIAGAK